jgi:hypothetical protein
VDVHCGQAEAVLNSGSDSISEPEMGNNMLVIRTSGIDIKPMDGLVFFAPLQVMILSKQDLRRESMSITS